MLQSALVDLESSPSTTGNDKAMAAVAILAGIALAVLGIRAGLRMLRKRYPTAADPLPLRDLAGFYSAALQFLRRNKWMIWVPYGLGLPGVAYQIINYFNVLAMHEADCGTPPAPVPWSPAPLKWHAEHLYYTLGRLDSYPNTWMETAIGGIVFFISFLLFPLLLRHIGRRIGNDTHEGLRLMRRILRPAWYVCFPVLLITIAIGFARSRQDFSHAPVFGLIAVNIMTFTLPVALCSSFIQGAILIAMHRRLLGEPWSLGTVYTRTLNALVPLLLWNLILIAVSLPLQVNQYLDWRLLEWLETPVYVMPLVTAVFYLLPFMIVSSPAPLRVSLRNHLQFLARHAAKCILFTLAGVLFLFAGETALNAAYLSIGYTFHVPSALATFLIQPAIHIALQAVFFTASWMFFLKQPHLP